MAKAIEIDYVPFPQTEAERLAAARQDAEPALTEALMLLTELHRHGVLELGLKLTHGAEGLTAAALDKLSSPSGAAVLRNALLLGKLLGDIDPGELQILARALGAGVHAGAASAEAGERVTLPGVARQLADEDVQLSLGVLFGLLRGMGASLREQRQHPITSDR